MWLHDSKGKQCFTIPHVRDLLYKLHALRLGSWQLELQRDVGWFTSCLGPFPSQVAAAVVPCRSNEIAATSPRNLDLAPPSSSRTFVP